MDTSYLRGVWAVIGVIVCALTVSVSAGVAAQHRVSIHQRQLSIQDCGKFAGPTHYLYSHSGRMYAVNTAGGVKCSLAVAYAKKFVGRTVTPGQLRTHIPYPKYVLSGSPKGFVCWADKASGLDDRGHVVAGTCSRGQLPRYTSDPTLGEFFWQVTGG